MWFLVGFPALAESRDFEQDANASAVPSCAEVDLG